MNAVPKWIDQEAWTPPNRSFEARRTSCAFIDEIFASRQLVDGEGRTVSLDVFVPAQQGDLLYSLVRYLRPRACVEVGLANGISTLHIAKALQENGSGHHTAIDPFQSCDWSDIGLVTLRRAGLRELVSLDPRPSHWVLPEMESSGRRIQFAFVDGSHLFDYVMADFLGIDRILDVGGVIAFDDSDWPAVNAVIRFAITNRDYRVLDTGVVIEPSPGRPRWMVQRLREFARRCSPLRRVLRHEFLFPSNEIGIAGRCVVLQKQSEDQRDNQTRQLTEF